MMFFMVFNGPCWCKLEYCCKVSNYYIFTNLFNFIFTTTLPVDVTQIPAVKWKTGQAPPPFSSNIIIGALYNY